MKALAALVALVIPVAVLAAGVDATIGRVAVAIPAPDNMTALRNAGSPFYKLNTSTQHNVGNRLLAAFLPSSSAAVADAGKLPTDHREWAFSMALPREDMEISPSVFKTQVVPVVEQMLAKLLVDEKLRKQINTGTDKGVQEIKKEFGYQGDPNLDIGQLMPLGIWAKTDDYLIYGAQTRVEITQTTGKRVVIPVAMGMVVANVRERVLQLTLYRRLEGDGDLEALRTSVTRWAEATVKTNRQ
jgi:hypothetical protein